MFNNFRKSKSAFSLIELLIAITIVAMIMIITIPKYKTFSQRNELAVVADMLTADINEARTYAIAPRSQDQNPYSYVVRIDLSNSGDDNYYWLGVKKKPGDSPAPIGYKDVIDSTINVQTDWPAVNSTNPSIYDLEFKVGEMGKISNNLGSSRSFETEATDIISISNDYGHKYVFVYPATGRTRQCDTKNLETNCPPIPNL